MIKMDECECGIQRKALLWLRWCWRLLVTTWMCVAHAGLIWENRPFQTSTPLSYMRPEICLCKPPEIWHDWAWIKRGWCVRKDPVIIIILIDLHSWPDLMKNAWSHCIHFCYFLKCKPIRPLSVQNLPACENTLQLVRNAQLAAGAGDGVWSKPPEKCRCCYCRRSDRRRSAADAGAGQSSTGRVVDTWCWHHQVQPKSDPD